MKGFHTKGVCQLAFSGDGTRLFSVGIDYTVAVYDTNHRAQNNLNFGKMVFSSQGPKGKVYHVSAAGRGGGDFVSCGEKHLCYWVRGSGASEKTYTCENGKLGPHRNKMLLSVARVDNKRNGYYVIGTADGDLVVFNGANIQTDSGTKHADKCAVNALWSNCDGTLLLSGGRDGRIKVWNTSNGSLQVLYSFDICGYSKSPATASSHSSGGSGSSGSTASAGGASSGTGGGKHAGAAATTATAKAPPSSTSSSSSIPAIRSVCMSPDQTRVLVGTQTCELLDIGITGISPAKLPVSDVELFCVTNAIVCGRSSTSPVHIPAAHTTVPVTVTATGAAVAGATTASAAGIVGRALVVGHFKDELWGLAVNPVSVEIRRGGAEVGSEVVNEVEREYCTVGDDGFLRLWSVARRCQKTCLNMSAMARCCCYSPDGCMIAVGFGGSVGRGKNREDGMVRIYRVNRGGGGTTSNTSSNTTSEVQLQLLTELKEAKQWVSVVRFSPDGATLAVGARDNSVYLYCVSQQFKRRAKFSKHNAGINQLDFSADGRVLQSCCR
jgi:WD40 repeat protein